MAEIVFLLLQEYHGNEVADLAQLVGTSIILFAVLSEGVLFDVEDLLVDIHALLELGLLL